MTLTDEQLNDVKTNYLDNKIPPYKWARDNDISRDDLKPQELISQLKTKYTEDVIKASMGEIAKSNLGERFDSMIDGILSRNFISVDVCIALLTSLQGCIVKVNAKKAELESGE